MTAKSPGPYSISSPSSITTFIRPLTKYARCAAWQLSVPAIGLTCCDQRQPGLKVARPTGCSARLTSWSWPVPLSKGRVSSGASRLMRISCDMATSCGRLWLVVRGCCGPDQRSCVFHGVCRAQSPFGPRSVVDADVGTSEEVGQDEPGGRGPGADGAVGDERTRS